MFDHQSLNPKLKIYSNDPLIGAGLPFLLPNGAKIRRALEDYVHDSEKEHGYDNVYSPVLARQELYEISGHWAHYQDSMFKPIEDKNSNLVLRPMNCPHHALIFKAEPRNYKQLPYRFSELANMFREERSGSLNGLSRVRAMTLADAHIFLSEDMIENEIKRLLEEIKEAYSHLGLEASTFRLSLRDSSSKYVQNDALWVKAEDALRVSLKASNIIFEEGVGEAAFYGPKIDVQVKNAHGKEETLSTIQLDFHLPEQFELEYVNSSNENVRPVMIHRSVVSTMERMISFLVEKHQGRLPLWLSPLPIVILPINDDFESYSFILQKKLKAEKIPSEIIKEGSLGSRIAKNKSAPLVVILGEKEKENESVSFRIGRRSVEPEPIDSFVEKLRLNIRDREVNLPW